MQLLPSEEAGEIQHEKQHDGQRHGASGDRRNLDNWKTRDVREFRDKGHDDAAKKGEQKGTLAVA